MSNSYRGTQLTPVEEAIVQQDIDRLNSGGTFSSQTEISAAIANRAYHVRGPLGDLYRAAFDSKGARTQAEKVSIIGNNKVSDMPTAAMQAGATRDAEGNLVVGVLDVTNPNGEVRGGKQQEAEATPSAESKFSNLGGGVSRVEMNQESLQRLGNRRFGSEKERLEREAYLAKARDKKR